MKSADHYFVFQEQQLTLHVLGSLGIIYIAVTLFSVAANFIKLKALSLNAIQYKQIKRGRIIKVVIKLAWILPRMKANRLTNPL